MKYAFILGKNPDLSLAELTAVYGKNALVAYNNQYAVFRISEKLTNPEQALDRLGGTTKIIEIFAKGNIDDAEKIFIDRLRGGGVRLFGVNVINLPGREREFLKKLLIPLKKNLKGEGKIRFVNKPFQNVSEVFAKKQKLIEKGAELNCIMSEPRNAGRALFGETVAIQDFEGYSSRDYGKPARDTKIGMLPPKLAQIIINLACGESDIKTQPVIYDPFCGTGTVLMEALLMGYQAIGSDINPRMIEAAQNNLDWLCKTHNITIPYRIFRHDACALTASTFANLKNLLIVTEPDLGPPLSPKASRDQIESIFIELSTLYLAFFKTLAATAPRDTVIVFIFPYIRMMNNELRITNYNQLIDKIIRLGFEVSSFQPNNQQFINYERPDQIVRREIRRFMKR